MTPDRNTSYKGTILAVDDTPDNLRLLTGMLSESGYKVRVATNGSMALESVRFNPPDLILLDVTMPDMDGYEVCEKLKADEKVRHIPVIFISAKNEPIDKVKAFQAGGGDYITKPLAWEEVLARIENQLKIWRLQKQLAEQNTQLLREIDERQQLESQLQQQFYRSELQRNITDKIRSEFEPEKIFATATKQIGEALKASRVVIYTYTNHPEATLKVAGEYLVAGCPSIFQFEISSQGNPYAEKILLQDRARASNQIQDDELLSPFLPLLRKFKIKSMLAVRTSYQGEANGLITLHQCDKFREWREEEIELLEAIAAQLGIALAQAKLLEQEQQAKTKLNQQNLQLQQEIRERQQLEELLLESQKRLSTIISTNADSLIVVDQSEIVRFVNPAGELLFGRSCEELLGQKFGLPLVVDEAIEVGIEHPLQGVITAEMRVVEIMWQGESAYLASLRDITDRKRAEQEVRLLLTTTQALGRANSVKTALTVILRLIGSAIAWDVGEAWVPSADGRVLQYNPGWYASQTAFEEFRTSSETITFAPNVGLPGRVWASQQPEWIEDISRIETSLYNRVDIGVKVGLTTAFGVPIVANDTVLAVLVFFKRSKSPPQGRLIELVSAVAAQLGSMIQRKVAETALRKSEERLQLALEGSALGLWDWNIETGDTYFDDHWKKMLGYEPQEIEHNIQGLIQLLHPEDMPRVMGVLNDYFQGKISAYEVEFRMLTKPGQWKWILARGKVFERDAEGNTLRMAGTHQDISERKTLEREIALRQAQLDAFFRCAPVGLSVIDEQLRYVQINEPLAEINGVPVREHLGKTLAEILPKIAFIVEPIYQNIFATGLPIIDLEVSAEVPGEPGIIRHWVISYFPIPDEEGQTRYVGTVVLEISERKRAEAAVRESQRRYQTLAEASPVCIFGTDINGYCLYVNQRWSEITGMPVEMALGRGWSNSLHPEDCERVLAQWSEAVQNKIRFNCEYRFVSPDGRITWVIAQALPEIGEDGEFKGYVGTIADITDRKQAETALRDSAERERLISTVIQRIRRTLDLETIFSATTSELRQAVNCDRVLVYRFNPDWSGEIVSESVANGWVSLFEEQKKDSLVRDAGIKAEECGVKSMAGGVNLVVDSYLQQTRGENYNRASYFVVSDLYHAGFEACYIQLLERLQARAYLTVPIFCGDKLWGLLGSYQNSGVRIWSEAEINIAVQIGTQLGVALQQAELLAQTQRQSAALQQAVIAADAANRAKSEFLANMSHELRTPLNAILGFSQIMGRDPNLNPQQQENLAIINRAGEHLLELINDILEMSKIEAGRTALNIHSFDLFNLLETLQGMLGLKAAAKNLKLVLEIANDVPQYVQTDEAKLRQILINIVGNGIKFTQQGQVILRVKPGENNNLIKLPVSLGNADKERGKMPSVITFEIEDTGEGIAPEEIDLLFEPFGQTETGRKSQQGTGLGLPISRKFAQLMGGDIRVKSTRGVGSLFAFDIEIEAAELHQIPVRSSYRRVVGLTPNQGEYRILVVDDRSESRLVLVKLLSSIGFLVREAENGRLGVDLWESWQPHLIFMDMRMPVMDGYEATKAIKSHLKGQATVVVALTASAFEEDRQIVLSAGCDDFVRKPFRQEVVLEKISQYLGVQYIFEDETKSADKSLQKTDKIASDVELKRHLLEMPRDWLVNLHFASCECSDESVFELIARIPPEKADLAEALRHFTNEFQFQKLMDLTQETVQ